MAAQHLLLVRRAWSGAKPLVFQATQIRGCSSSATSVSSSAAISRTFIANSSITKVLIANRGEIACRVMTTARRLGLGTVAVFSEADRASRHVQMADEAYCIGGAAARDSYLRADAVLAVALKAGAQAIHPGYGFLSENAEFAEACAKAGVAFVGPPASAIRAMGDKAQAKHAMSAAGVPVVPGYHGDAQDDATLMDAAKSIGFPLLVKAVSGGGGKGMKLARNIEELPDALSSARREAAASFGDDRLLLERYITRPRHVEVQVVTDGHGGGVYLFDRDCSVQRRHQKIIEEAPAPGLPGEFHAMIGEAAVRAAHAVNYRNAGTVEFIVDMDAPGTSSFYFMEMNTRLQVEHPVSEAVSGVDLVEWQLLVAAGGKLPMAQQQVFIGNQVCNAGPHGHSFEARLYAENPRNNFLPGSGTVHRWRPPPSAVAFESPALPPGTHAQSTPYVRVDSGVREGDTVGTNYDPMIAKIITWAPDRTSALGALRNALDQTQVAGLPTNLAYLKRLCSHPAFIDLDLDTGFVQRHAGTLLAPQPVTPTVAAVAGVARLMLQVLDSGPSRPGGPWGIPDSKRLWHHLTVTYPDMSVPEAQLRSAASVRQEAAAAAKEAASVASHSWPGEAQGRHKAAEGLSIQVCVRSVEDFNVHVHGLDESAGEGTHDLHRKVAVRHARMVGADQLQAEVAGRRLHADVSRFIQGGDEVLSVWLDEDQYEFRWPVGQWSKDVRSVGSSSSAGGQVKAPMPGRVVKVLVEEGQKVSAGAALVLVEAMKMEHPVVAGRAGKVTQLAVAPGVQVTDGQLLMIIEEETPKQTAK